MICFYRIQNKFSAQDEIAPARSVSFDADGARIFCGFEKTIRVFNVDTPGRNFEERKTFGKFGSLEKLVIFSLEKLVIFGLVRK